MVSRLYIVRHGKTIYNAERRIQGQSDTALSSEGIIQAHKAANYLKDYHFDVAYSSPLQRAYKTAEIILEGRNMIINTDERLMEMGFGSHEGEVVSLEELYVLIHSDLKAAGGESPEDVANRMYEAIEEIAKKNPNKDILITSHGSAIIAFLDKIEKDCIKKRLGKAVVTNCSLTTLNYVDDHFEIIDISYDKYMND